MGSGSVGGSAVFASLPVSELWGVPGEGDANPSLAAGSNTTRMVGTLVGAPMAWVAEAEGKTWPAEEDVGAAIRWFVVFSQGSTSGGGGARGDGDGDFHPNLFNILLLRLIVGGGSAAW